MAKKIILFAIATLVLGSLAVLYVQRGYQAMDLTSAQLHKLEVQINAQLSASTTDKAVELERLTGPSRIEANESGSSGFFTYQVKEAGINPYKKIVWWKQQNGQVSVVKIEASN